MTAVIVDYLNEVMPTAKSQDAIRYAALPIVDFFEGKVVSEITKVICQSYEKWRKKAAGTVRRELGVLAAALNHAVGENRLTHSPKIFMPQMPEPRERYLTKSEAARLLRASLRLEKSRHYLPLFILIGLHTGQRREAILSLQWSQVDLDSGFIRWNPVGRKQTKKKRPTSRIPTKLIGHLRRAARYKVVSDYVLHNDGKRMKDLKKSFANACKKAGLEGVTPHTMRHTRATWGMQSGKVSTWELAGFLGMSEQTLIRVYGKHHPDYQSNAAENY
ncbi:MAG: site-specific integrase [Terasakiella sp.]|uniref:site-specific integrase n=1 Tax=unclassified Terasakiella TaxID=2614952 RepID=UPI003AFFEF0A